VGKTLHYSVEKACVSRISHSESYLLVIVFDAHKLEHLVLACLLDVAGKVVLECLLPLALQFELLPPLGRDGGRRLVRHFAVADVIVVTATAIIA
jgi:hypothetical protein